MLGESIEVGGGLLGDDGDMLGGEGLLGMMEAYWVC